MSRAEAQARAEEYFQGSVDSRSEAQRRKLLQEPDILSAVITLLKNSLNSIPAQVLDEAAALYSCLSQPGAEVGLFDEAEYFRGEVALLAGNTCRFLGKRDETERWLDRAESGFRHTINASPLLARVAYTRLVLRYDMRRYDEVVELLPSVSLSFSKLSMAEDYFKCRFLGAMTFKELGRVHDSASAFEALITDLEFSADKSLKGLSLLNLGNLRSAQGEHEYALRSYSAALPLLKESNRPAALADLKGMVGETLRQLGQKSAAVDAYREAVTDCVSLGMQTRAAYFRVILAEALLEADRPREAEWEILAALPIIDEEKMVPEGFAAVTLLQEAVKNRKANPQALSELRSYLQAQA